MFHRAADAKPFSNIRTQGPDVSAFGTVNLQGHKRKRNLFNLNLRYFNVNRLSLDDLSFPGQVIQPFSADLFGGIHRRHLIVSALEKKRSLRDLALRQCLQLCLPGFIQNRSRQILRVRRDPQSEHSPIGFIVVRQIFRESAGCSEEHRKNADGSRVQCPGMTDLFLPQDAAQSGNNIIARIAGFLVDIQKSVPHQDAVSSVPAESMWSCSATFATILFTTS